MDAHTAKTDGFSRLSPPLAQFANWWCNARVFKPPAVGGISFGGVYSDGEQTAPRHATSIVLYRDTPFQVVLIFMHPNSFLPDHTHPNVESIAVHLTGDMAYRRNGVVEEHWDSTVATTSGRKHTVKPDGTSVNFGQMQAVYCGLTHGGQFGPQGEVFLSIERWLKGEPGHVHENWKFAEKNHGGDAGQCRGTSDESHPSTNSVAHS